MSRSLVIPLLLVTFSCLSCGDDNPESPNPDLQYPTTLRPLEQSALEALRADYSAENPRICSTLNEYGFTSGTCLGGVGLPPNIDVAAMVGLAKAAIVANARYTGVSDSSTLRLHASLVIPGRFVRMAFDRQIYAGLEVVGRSIQVLIDSLGVFSIDGNYYPEIFIPAEPLLCAGEAQESILDLEIGFEDSGGDPEVFVVATDSFQGEPTKVIFVNMVGDAIELRVAWQIPVGPVDQAWWLVYVDTMDGRMLSTDQLVIF